MVIEHRTLSLFGKKVFEKAIVTPPFKNSNPLVNEACFLYVFEGKNNSLSEQELLVLEQGEGVLMKCGNYVYDLIPDITSKRSGIMAIHFYPEVLKKLYEKELPSFLKSKSISNKNMAKVQYDVVIKKYTESLLHYFDNPDLASDEILALKLKEIILLLLNTSEGSAIRDIMNSLFNPRSFSFKEVVEAHIFSQVSINDLASLTNRSLASFKRAFAKEYRDSPANYIKNRRLEKAAEMLLVTDATISSIAYDCQFSDTAYFATAFKAKYKVTPSQYRIGS